MISYIEAEKILYEKGLDRSPDIENRSIQDSVGFVLAQDIISHENVPSFTNSAMDGFAISSEWTKWATKNLPLILQVGDQLVAGEDTSSLKVHKNLAFEIMTGSMLPSYPIDTVIRIEDVCIQKNHDGKITQIILDRKYEPGENVRLVGTDISVGQILMNEGHLITHEDLLALASLGKSHIPIKKWPKIALISTGSELVDYKVRDLAAGKIRNTSALYLLSMMTEANLNPEWLGIVQDDQKSFEKKISDAILNETELILSTGAVSMGKLDFVVDAIRNLGAKIYFHKSAIRPGKPILFAEFSNSAKKTLFIGLPGNPISSAVGLRFFVVPFLRGYMNFNLENAQTMKLENDFQKPQGLRCFFKAQTRVENSISSVLALKGQASYMVSTMRDANAWVVFEESKAMIKAGEEVKVYPLRLFSKEIL
jgi:molybdopterin molybdotransferase